MFEFCFIRLESSCCRLDGGVVGSRNLSASSCHDDVDDEEVLSNLAVVVVASSAGPLVENLCCCCTNAADDDNCSDQTAAMVTRLDDDGATILACFCPDRIPKTRQRTALKIVDWRTRTHA
jgi:hypothetical protein